VKIKLLMNASLVSLQVNDRLMERGVSVGMYPNNKNCITINIGRNRECFLVDSDSICRFQFH